MLSHAKNWGELPHLNYSREEKNSDRVIIFTQALNIFIMFNYKSYLFFFLPFFLYFFSNMATQNLIDPNTLSPKFKDLYAKAKDFVEVKQIENIRVKAY